MIAAVALALLLSDPPTGDPTSPAASAEPDDTSEVRHIVVTATRTEHAAADAPVATQVYDRRAIEDSGAENLGEILEETPGVQVSRGIGGVGIRMQGLDPEYTVVLVDGQRTTGRINGVMDLSRFPAEDIEHVEIVRGPSSVLYGADALAGTINLVTRKPKKPHEAEAHFAYGSFGTIDLTGRVGMSRKRWSGSIGGGFHRTEGWDADPSDPSTTGPRSTQVHALTTQELETSGPFSLGLRASYLQRDALLVSAQPTGAIFDQRSRTEVIQATVRPRLQWAIDRLTLHASYNLFRDQFLQDQRGSSALDQGQDTLDHLGQATLQYDHDFERHVLTMAADGQVELLVTERIDPPSVDRQRYAILVQDEWTPVRSPKIVVLPGARLDYDSFFGIYPTPRLALMVAPSERWTLRASYGRGYRAPSFREMFLFFSNPSVGYTVRGNPGLRAETSWSASISAEVRPWDFLWLAASVFDNRLTDTITTDTVDASDVDTPTLFRYVNIGEATTRGVETQAAITILRRLVIDGSYTFVHAWDHTQDRVLPGRPRHSGTAGLRWSRPQWGTAIAVRSSILGPRAYFSDTDGDDVEDETQSPAFATLDARVSQAFTRHVQVFAGIENALDAGNATDTPLQPRTFYGGVTVRY
jgi:outer membrane receptor for ferrienterochelin and colicins